MVRANQNCACSNSSVSIFSIFLKGGSKFSILAVSFAQIDQPLIPIKRGLNSMLFISFWCPKPTSTSRHIDTGVGNRN